MAAPAASSTAEKPPAQPAYIPEESLPTGPSHKAGLVCADDEALNSCPQCQRKIFILTANYFQKEFSDQAVKSHGAEAVCKEADCPICKRGEPWKITCPGHLCSKATGQLQHGLLGVELLQYHTTKEHLAEFGPLKKCGCPIHIRLHLVCSEPCYKSSIFGSTKPLGDVNWEDVKNIFTLTSRGPVAIVQQYLLDVLASDIAEKEVKKALQIETPQEEEDKTGSTTAATTPDTCSVCSASGANKWCSRCKNRSIRYCSRDCQVKDWANHKTSCNTSS